MSPLPVSLDFTFPDNCIYTNFNPDSLMKYYSAYRSTNLAADFGSDYAGLDKQLQAFKNFTGIPDLQTHLSGATDKYSLEAYTPGEPTPFSVHGVEMDGSGNCFGSNSWKQFGISTAAGSYVYQIRDPAKSNWEITKFLGNGPFTVDIGKGGYAGALYIVDYGILTAVLIIAAVVAGAVLAEAGVLVGAGAVVAENPYTAEFVNRISLTFTEGVRDSIGSIGSLGRRQSDDPATIVQPNGIAFTATSNETNGTATIQATVPDLDVLVADGTDVTQPKQLRLYGWYDIYQPIPLEHRQACVLSHWAFQQQDCWVAGTAIIIQADGTTVAHPLPDVSHAAS